ncbi:MAG: 50S ribosomal protein L10 [Candidatus Nezhaarchaeota archaeon]|nr:50S ribosomal protein L10 [Candidatus Nezhaarchaeota archaeon]
MSFQILKAADKKRKVLQEIVEMMSRYKTIAVADITGLRAVQFQRLKKGIRGRLNVKVAKNSLIRKAVEELKEQRGIDATALNGVLEGQTAIVVSDLNPFEIYNILEKFKVPAKAKPGDVAIKDIVLPAGNTGLTPGPVLSLFKKFKVPIKIEEGSIHVTKDTIVIRTGEVIPAEVADLLSKLGIEPMEVGLKIKAAYSEGLVYKADNLKIDVGHFRESIVDAASKALSLAINSAFFSRESSPHILAKAVVEATLLAIKARYPAGEALSYMVAEAHAKAMALNNILSKLSSN